MYRFIQLKKLRHIFYITIAVILILISLNLFALYKNTINIIETSISSSNIHIAQSIAKKNR